MMESRPVSSRDYCEKASPDVAIFKKKEKKRKKIGWGGLWGRRETYTAGGKKKEGNGVRFHIFLSYNNRISEKIISSSFCHSHEYFASRFEELFNFETSHMGNHCSSEFLN